MKPRIVQTIRHLIIGLVIGVVDLVPGISGGTVAFAFGVWEKLLDSIALFFQSIVSFGQIKITSARRQLADIDWLLVIPVGVGVVCSLVLGASVIGFLLDEQEQYIRSFFLGLVFGALPIPIKRVTNWNQGSAVLLALGFAVSFFIAGASGVQTTDPPLYFVFFGAAVSICAMILPGLSGSFILLILGLYDTLIDSVRQRDMMVLAMFASGSWFGSFLFVSRIRWLLQHHSDPVLAILIGLMVGGLRVLWPWSDVTGDPKLFADAMELALVVSSVGLGCLFALLMQKLVAVTHE